MTSMVVEELKQIDARIELLLFQLGEYQGYASPNEIDEGYPSPDEIKEKIKELNKERRKLLKSLI